MTAMAMGVGYLIAAGGPALVGAVHDSQAVELADHRAAGDDGRRSCPPRFYAAMNGMPT